MTESEKQIKLNWYDQLIEDSKNIIKKNVALGVIVTHYMVGERVNKDYDKLLGEHSIENLAKDIGVAESGLKASMAFFKAVERDFGTLEKFLSSSNVLDYGKLSWKKIVKFYLYGNGEEKEKQEKPVKMVQFPPYAAWLKYISTQEEAEAFFIKHGGHLISKMECWVGTMKDTHIADAKNELMGVPTQTSEERQADIHEELEHSTITFKPKRQKVDT